MLQALESRGLPGQQSVIARERTDQAVEARLLFKRGTSHLDCGDGAAACLDLERAAELAGVADDARLRGAVAAALGAAYGSIGEHVLAVAQFEIALQWAEESGDTDSRIQLLGDIGLAHRHRLEYGRAIVSLSRAVELLGTDADPVARAHLLARIGVLHSHANRASDAMSYLKRAMAILDEVDEPGRYVTLISLGATHALQGEFTESLVANERALELAAVANDTLHVDLASVSVGLAYLRLGNHGAAIRYLEPASISLRNRHRPADLARSLIGLGTALDASGEPEAATAVLNEARLAALDGSEDLLPSDVLLDLARIHTSLGGHERAYTVTKNAYASLRPSYSREHDATSAEFQARTQAAENASRVRTLGAQALISELRLSASRKAWNNMAALVLLSVVVLVGLGVVARSRARALTGLRVEESDLASHYAHLKVALAEVATLRGMLPICSYCRRIRDARGEWAPPEDFIGERADVIFSRHLCPECSVVAVDSDPGPSSTGAGFSEPDDAGRLSPGV